MRLYELNSHLKNYFLRIRMEGQDHFAKSKKTFFIEQIALKEQRRMHSKMKRTKYSWAVEFYLRQRFLK